MVEVMARSLSARAIVDASVAVKWVLDEDHSDAALRILENEPALAAPAHWLVEALNALRAACQRNELSRQGAYDRAKALVEAPITAVPLGELGPSAMEIGLRLSITIYDALYLALAEREGATLITDDRRLLQAARRDEELRDRVRWIGDG